jgi:hypothetical protein
MSLEALGRRIDDRIAALARRLAEVEAIIYEPGKAEPDGSKDRVDPVAGPATTTIDPDTPRRFRWPRPDGSGGWDHGCYFPARRRYVTDGYSAPAMPSMDGIEWIDPAPARAGNRGAEAEPAGDLPPGWRSDDGRFVGPEDIRVAPSDDRPGEWFVSSGPAAALPWDGRRYYPDRDAAIEAARRLVAGHDRAAGGIVLPAEDGHGGPVS